MSRIRLDWIQKSFGAKLLAALVGSVGLLLAITLVAVRAQTNRQIRLVEDRTIASAGELFQELEDLQRQQADQFTRPFRESRRTVAILDEAIRSGDLDYLSGEASYQFELLGLGDFEGALVVLTDDFGRPLFSMIGGQPLEGDPAEVSYLAEALVGDESGAVVMSEYRLVDDRLYNLRAHFIEFARQPVGTVTFGLPVGSGEIDRIARIGGFEACLSVAAACVASSSGVGPEMEAAMIEALERDGALRTELGGAEWSIQHEDLVADRPDQGVRIVAVPLDAVRAPFENIQTTLLLAGFGALLLCGLVGVGLSRSLTRPVRDLVAATGRVAKGDYEAEVQVESEDEMGTLAHAFNDMTRGLLMREQYRSVLNKVVSTDVAEELMKGTVELGGENREMTVLFADIRGFTPLTQGMEPQQVIGFLNECMDKLSRAVDAEGGVVDKFIGDEIMAVFGAPVVQGDHAVRAVRAALRMREGVAEMNAERARRGEAPLAVGIGIASGVAVAGNMGSNDRLNYTVLGETVNLAARLTDQAKPGEILVSERTQEWTAEGLVASCVGERALKGFSEGCLVYSVEAFEDAGATAG